MADKTVEERLTALEVQLGKKTLEEHFRGQAELIDRRFSDSFRENAELIDRRFADSFREQAELIDRLFAYRFEALDAKLKPIRADLAIIKHAVGVLLTRVT